MNKKIYGLLSTSNSVAIAFALAIFVVVCNDLTTGISLGLIGLILLVLSNLIFGAASKVVPNDIAYIVYVLVVSTLTIITGFVLSAYAISIANSFSNYYPLLIVSILFLSKGLPLREDVSFSEIVKDALKTGLFFLMAAVELGLYRQLLGSGNLNLISPTDGSIIFNLDLFANFSMPIFSQLSGGFIVLACIVAGMNLMLEKKGEK